MFHRSPKTTARAIKHDVYAILKRLHELETKRGQNRIASVQFSDGEKNVVILLDELHNFMSHCLNSIYDRETKLQVRRYLSYIRHLQRLIKRNCSSKKALKRGHLRPLLTYHTQLFNTIIVNDIAVQADPQKWDAIMLQHVMLWNNELRSRLRKL